MYCHVGLTAGGTKQTSIYSKELHYSKTHMFGSFKCTRILVSNIILWYPSLKSIPAWKTSGWTGEDKSCCCLCFQHQLEVQTLCDRQGFLAAQICTGMQGIFYINTELIVVPAQTHFQFPPPVVPGQWNYSKLHLCWLKQMLSYGNRRDFHTGLRLFSSHTKILPPIREPSCCVSGKLIENTADFHIIKPRSWWPCCSTAPTDPFWILNTLLRCAERCYGVLQGNTVRSAEAGNQMLEKAHSLLLNRK